MTDGPEPAAPAERPRFCPWCGEPVGWFFGRFETRGATWCDRCQEWFAVQRVDDDAVQGE